MRRHHPRRGRSDDADILTPRATGPRLVRVAAVRSRKQRSAVVATRPLDPMAARGWVGDLQPSARALPGGAGLASVDRCRSRPFRCACRAPASPFQRSAWRQFALLSARCTSAGKLPIRHDRADESAAAPSVHRLDLGARGDRGVQQGIDVYAASTFDQDIPNVGYSYSPLWPWRPSSRRQPGRRCCSAAPGALFFLLAGDVAATRQSPGISSSHCWRACVQRDRVRARARQRRCADVPAGEVGANSIRRPLIRPLGYGLIKTLCWRGC